MCVSQYEILEAIIEFLREECCVNSKTDVAEPAGKKWVSNRKTHNCHD